MRSRKHGRKWWNRKNGSGIKNRIRSPTDNDTIKVYNTNKATERRRIKKTITIWNEEGIDRYRIKSKELHIKSNSAGENMNILI